MGKTGKQIRRGLRRKTIGHHRLIALTALVACFAQPAAGFEFTLGEDVQGAWNTTATIGSSWRMEGRDPNLVSVNNGGTGAFTVTDDGNLNWDKGDRFSTILKAVSDVELKYKNYGGLVRLKAWYDYDLENRGVPHGHIANGFVPGAELNDSGFEPRARFSGIEWLDAFVYGKFNAGQNDLNLRFGRQVVNWGESLFIQGVNQINPIDVPALRRPGAEIKEALLPVWMLYGNLGIKGGPTLEGFYQLKWEKTAIDGCGTYFSSIDIGLDGCNGTLFGPAGFSDQTLYNAGLVIPRAPDIKPGNRGQWGVALRQIAEPLDTEFGLYYMNIHSRTPILSLYKGAALSFPLNVFSSQYVFEWPKNIEILGVSAATNLSGWSVSAELSHTPKYPVQLNAIDLLTADAVGLGPLGAQAAAAPAGGYMKGFDDYRKTQFQVNAIKAFGHVLGASSLALVGEVGFQWVNVPDLSVRRYGRSPLFGFAEYAPQGLSCPVVTAAGLQTYAPSCANDGFITGFSWGYRIRAQLDYPGLLGDGIGVQPSLFWGHDVKGHSADSQFSEGRKTLGLGVRFDYNKRHFVDINYTTYANSAKWDTTRDRDFVSMSFGTTF